MASSLPAGDSVASPEEISAAIKNSIRLLEKGAKGSAEERTCFTCHNQAVPVLALAEVRKRGFAIDEKNFENQLQHTAAHLERGKKNYVKTRAKPFQTHFESGFPHGKDQFISIAASSWATMALVLTLPESQ